MSKLNASRISARSSKSSKKMKTMTVAEFEALANQLYHSASVRVDKVFEGVGLQASVDPNGKYEKPVLLFARKHTAFGDGATVARDYFVWCKGKAEEVKAFDFAATFADLTKMQVAERFLREESQLARAMTAFSAFWDLAHEGFGHKETNAMAIEHLEMVFELLGVPKKSQ